MHIILQNTAAIKAFMELYGDVTNVSTVESDEILYQYPLALQTKPDINS